MRNNGSNIRARRESKAVFFVTSLKAMIMACWVTKSINRVNPAWSAVGDSPYCPLKRFLRVGMDSPTEGTLIWVGIKMVLKGEGFLN